VVAALTLGRHGLSRYLLELVRIRNRYYACMSLATLLYYTPGKGGNLPIFLGLESSVHVAILYCGDGYHCNRATQIFPLVNKYYSDTQTKMATTPVSWLILFPLFHEFVV
jgi:hypothetical protein